MQLLVIKHKNRKLYIPKQASFGTGRYTNLTELAILSHSSKLLVVDNETDADITELIKLQIKFNSLKAATFNTLPPVNA